MIFDSPINCSNCGAKHFSYHPCRVYDIGIFLAQKELDKRWFNKILKLFGWKIKIK
jgi:hypothetical protein